MKKFLAFAFLLCFASVASAQYKDVMIRIPPGQYELKSIGYGEPDEGVGLKMYDKQTFSSTKALIKFQEIADDDKISTFVESSMASHLNLINGFPETDISNKSVGELKETDDGKFKYRDITVEFKEDSKIFPAKVPAKKLYARTMVRVDGQSVAFHIQSPYEREIKRMTAWSEKLKIRPDGE